MHFARSSCGEACYGQGRAYRRPSSGIVSKHSDKILQRLYGGDVMKVPAIDYLGSAPTRAAEVNGVTREFSGETTTYTVGSAPPSQKEWLEVLAGSTLSWLRALITSPTIVQGTSYVANPIQRLLIPRVG